MGSSSSKVAGKAGAAASRRQYPSTSSILNSAASSKPTAPPQVAHPSSQSETPVQVRQGVSSAPPSTKKSEHIDLDGRDPDFGSALRKIGPAIPVEQSRPNRGAASSSSRPLPGQYANNFYPPNPATNPSLIAITARGKIGETWEEETESLGRQSFAGRTMISAKEITELLRMRDQRGMANIGIEKQLRLKHGVLEKLGNKNFVANA